MVTEVLEVTCHLQCLDLISTLEDKLAKAIMLESCLEPWDFAKIIHLPSLEAKPTRAS